ncbi:hypothetical protein R70006_06175 [Paraburkholderia domus]|uniref:hypothetical protein n=1 Tax=Paraburkholderia domus TaxID=2793075 RepID=UPI001914ABAC|nr:hypothetical protein [Paraburkholderia domus]MBK5052809.1 hypothetical protein [Burkholderia sp. R-70006]CAE6820505.1 hypothetical protein R70006_06175 [Paraburkholderia domus]
MTTHRFDEKHDATIRPVDKLAPGRYQCQVNVGLTDGSLTESSFVGEGKTAKQATSAALALAAAAIQAGRIKYRKETKKRPAE